MVARFGQAQDLPLQKRCQIHLSEYADGMMVGRWFLTVGLIQYSREPQPRQQRKYQAKFSKNSRLLLLDWHIQQILRQLHTGATKCPPQNVLNIRKLHFPSG